MQKKKYHQINLNVNVGTDASVCSEKQKMKQMHREGAVFGAPRENRGITLIALIITIIVMLILVAVTVRTVVNGGLFKHAGDAVNGYSMQEARERLSTTLSGALAEKYTNPNYNEDNFLNEYIKDNLPDSKIIEDIVIVDGWAFELDRSVPKIKQD